MKRVLPLVLALLAGCSGDYRPYEYISFANADGAEILATSREPSPNTWVPFAVPTVTRIVRDNYQLVIMLTEKDGRRAHVKAATLDGKPVLIDSPYIWGPFAHEDPYLPEVKMLFFFEWVPGDPTTMEINVANVEGQPLWSGGIPFTVVKSGVRHYPNGYHTH